MLPPNGSLFLHRVRRTAQRRHCTSTHTLYQIGKPTLLHRLSPLKGTLGLLSFLLLDLGRKLLLLLLDFLVQLLLQLLPLQLLVHPRIRVLV